MKDMAAIVIGAHHALALQLAAYTAGPRRLKLRAFRIQWKTVHDLDLLACIPKNLLGLVERVFAHLFKEPIVGQAPNVAALIGFDADSARPILERQEDRLFNRFVRR